MRFLERHSLDDFSFRVHGITLGVIFGGIAFFALLHYLYFDVNVWAGWDGGMKERTIHRAERVYMNSIFKTRANTWSNYAFIIVGIYALAFTILDKRRENRESAAFIVRHPMFGMFFGLGCVYLGLASGLWHASLTPMGARLDVASMYAGMVALIMMYGYRQFPKIPGTQLDSKFVFAVLIVLVNVLLFVFKHQMPLILTMVVFVLTLAALIILDLFRKESHFLRYWPLLSMVCLIVGGFCREIDVSERIKIDPDTIFQGHALWHVFCALSLGFIYLYQRSEHVRKR